MAVSREQWAWVSRMQARPRRGGGYWRWLGWLSAFYWTFDAVIAGLDGAWVHLGLNVVAAGCFIALAFDTRRREPRREAEHHG